MDKLILKIKRRIYSHTIALTFPPFLPFFPADVAGCGHHAAVPAGGAQDAAPHPAALLRLQGHLGLDHPHPDLLHGHHGALQRGAQEQDLRGRQPARGRLNRRCDILHRYVSNNNSLTASENLEITIAQ